MSESCDCLSLVPTDTFGLALQLVDGHLPTCHNRTPRLTGPALIERLVARLTALQSEHERLLDAVGKDQHEIEQVLGRALGYPLLYPEASTVDDGTVGVGDHVAATLAVEAAERIRTLTADRDSLRDELAEKTSQHEAAKALALRAAAERNALARLCVFSHQDSGEWWSFVGDFGPVPYRSLVKSGSEAEAVATVRGAVGFGPERSMP